MPYRGSAPALNDLLGGHIDVMFDAMPMMSVQAKEGKVTPIAVTGAKRSAALPDVATMQESGLTYEITGWYGILAPPGTPPAIVQKLRDEVAKAVAPPDIVKTLATQGMEPRGTQPADFAKYMASELAFYKQDRQGREHQAGVDFGLHLSTSWPGLSRPSTSCCCKKAWMPGTSRA